VRITGLDISLNRTGWCTYDTEAKSRTYDIIGSDGLKGYARIAYMAGQIVDVIRNSDLVVMEALVPGRFSGRGHADTTGLTYIVRVWLWKKQVRTMLVAPTSLKKFATGNGKAEKSVMRLAVFKRWGIDTSEASDDIADAIALCEMGRMLENCSDEPPTQYQKECIKKMRFLEDSA